MSSPLTVGQNPITTLIASGLAERSTTEPLVAVFNDGEPNSYRILIHFYIPDGPIPVLDTDFNTIETRKTDAGNIKLRLININYEYPEVQAKTFSLWKINVTYIVNGPGAEALLVRVFPPHISDPETTRGTVTSVATT